MAGEKLPDKDLAEAILWAAQKSLVSVYHALVELQDRRAAEATRGAGADAIVEKIMTQHWDMAACDCWVCQDGRAAGLRAREEHLHAPSLPRVTVQVPEP